MKTELSEHFTYKKLLMFTLPSMLMMIFVSIYGVVDGFFVSNFVGKTAFAAVNFIMPYLIILGAPGYMIGTGGCALIAKTMGEGKPEKANEIFSMLVAASVIGGIALSVLGIIFIRPVGALLGADGAMLDSCVKYGRIILSVLPIYILQIEFQSLFVAAQKPNLGLLVTGIAGVTNMILDAVLVAGFSLGIPGAAAATAISQCVGGIIPLFYFFRKNKSLLKFTKPKFNGKTLLKTCTNGSSELMSSLAMSLAGMLYNIQLLKYAGENGVSSYGVLMYVSMIFSAMFFGYSMGSAPIISYHFGAANRTELKSLFKKSTVIIVAFSVSMLILSEVLAYPLSHFFVGYDTELLALTCRGFKIYSFAFLFMGTAIFGSGFFTALNDGFTSAAISFLRTLIFQVAAVIVLPILWGVDGIWISLVASEFMAVLVTLFFIIIKRKKYGYI